MPSFGVITKFYRNNCFFYLIVSIFDILGLFSLTIPRAMQGEAGTEIDREVAEIAQDRDALSKGYVPDPNRTKGRR